MKKTLLATAIIGALGASAAAQAATVYDQDGTRLDVYGRIAMGIEGGGTFEGGASNSAEFVDVFSRLGLRMSQEVTSDLTAFGHVEWRFRGDERTGAGRVVDGDGNNINGFSEVRHSFIGLQSQQYGTFQAGNFDGFYNQFVAAPFDIYINKGLELQGGEVQARGDSIGYYTPELNGFTAALQLKHYSDRGESLDRDSTVVAAQGAVRYAEGPVTVGLGFIEDVVRGDGTGEMIYGLTGAYDINDQFVARLGYETQSNDDNGSNGFDTVGLGGTFTTGPWAFNVDYYYVDSKESGVDSRNTWSAGAYYKVSSNFDVFVELNDADADSDRTVSEIRDDVYWLTGARYFF